MTTTARYEKYDDIDRKRLQNKPKHTNINDSKVFQEIYNSMTDKEREEIRREVKEIIANGGKLPKSYKANV